MTLVNIHETTADTSDVNRQEDIAYIDENNLWQLYAPEAALQELSVAIRKGV